MYAEWPEVDFAIESKGELSLESPIIKKSAFLFLKYGFLSIRNAFDLSLIRNLREFYLQKYGSYFEDKDYPDALRVGERRTMISLSLEGPFNDPQFYAAPGLFPLLQLILGSDLVINSLGSVVSLPGAADQHVHRDHPNIYAASQDHQLDLSWIEKAPPYAVTLAVPLIALTKATGGTRFWPGTHLDT
ncbi:MAG: phytanoyl-CoA dioxygenase family protein, partial [Pseudomonadales bacterium]